MLQGGDGALTMRDIIYVSLVSDDFSFILLIQTFVLRGDPESG